MRPLASSTASWWRATSSLDPATWWASSMITMSQPASSEGPEPGRIVGLHLLGAPTRPPPKRLDRVERAHHLVEHTPRVDTAVDRQSLGTDADEFLAEALRHLGDPLELHASSARRRRPAAAFLGPSSPRRSPRP